MTEQGTSRIVAGIDGSPASLEALAWAAHQADLTGSSLEVLAAWIWPNTQWGWNGVVPLEYDPVPAVKAMLERALADVTASHPNLQVSGRVEEGHPSPLLVEASRGADLLVVGSRGHGEFVGMLLGSVGEYCVTQAHCPVVVVRPAG